MGRGVNRPTIHMLTEWAQRGLRLTGEYAERLDDWMRERDDYCALCGARVTDQTTHAQQCPEKEGTP